MTAKRKSIHRSTRPVLWALLEDRILSELRESRAHFIDKYLSGSLNLSQIPAPSCLEDVGFMPAPRPYGDSGTNKLVKELQALPHWNAQKVFKDVIKLLRKSFAVSGVSISLMETNKQVVKFESSFGLDNVPRTVSIDGHAILSKETILLSRVHLGSGFTAVFLLFAMILLLGSWLYLIPFPNPHLIPGLQESYRSILLN